MMIRFSSYVLLFILSISYLACAEEDMDSIWNSCSLRQNSWAEAPESRMTLAEPAGSGLPLHATRLGGTLSLGAYASSNTESPPPKKLRSDFSWHVAPYTGYTMGGKFDFEVDEDNEEDIDIRDSSSYGLLVAWNQTSTTQIEFYYSHQETDINAHGLFPDFDLDIEYYHIGGTVLINPSGRPTQPSKWQPFFTGGLGLARFDPKASGVDTINRFSMSFGGGVRYFPIERVGLYLGGRAFLTFMESEMEGSFGSEGNHIEISADALWQFQLCVGLMIVF